MSKNKRQGNARSRLEKIVAFTKLFLANRGNHNEITAQKFLPTFTFEELEEAVSEKEMKRRKNLTGFWSKFKDRIIDLFKEEEDKHL